MIVTVMLRPRLAVRPGLEPAIARSAVSYPRAAVKIEHTEQTQHDQTLSSGSLRSKWL